MIKSAFSILAVAAAAGIALTPAVASAATARPAVLAYSSSPSVQGPQPTTATFTVTSGALSISVPATVDIGSGTPGSTISGPLGAVTVTDDRALLDATWTVTVSATDWVTGAGTPAETIPAGDVTYTPGTISHTGTITVTGAPRTLANTAAPVVAGATGTGNNTATWNPTLTVAVPAPAVGGLYTGTVTHSVS